MRMSREFILMGRKIQYNVQLARGFHQNVTHTRKNAIAIKLGRGEVGRLGYCARAVANESPAGASSPQSTERKRLQENWEENLSSMRLNACASLYQYMHSQWLSTRKPLCGIDFDVIYADTWPRAPSHIPVVVGLHGTAASHLYFSTLASYMALHGVRFIVPNFPGCGFTQLDKERVFNHSPRERASFVIDFLNTLGISKVNVLVAHSAGAYPGLVLAKDPDMFESLALLNPGGYTGEGVVKHIYLFKLILKLIDFGIPLRSIAYEFVKSWNKNAPGVNFGMDPFEVGVRSMVLNDFDEIKADYLELKYQQVPLMMAYARNDTILVESASNAVADLLEMESHDRCLYNDKAEITQTGKLLNTLLRPSDRYAHCIVFDKGGHSILKYYPEIIEKSIFHLLNHVLNKRFLQK